jgi:hypothetical protein
MAAESEGLTNLMLPLLPGEGRGGYADVDAAIDDASPFI